MPQPSGTTAISRPELAQLVMEFRETAATGAIGPQVMPYFGVAKDSSEFPVIPKEELLKIPNTTRAMRQTYPRSDWAFEMGFYATRENGWEEAIDDRERKLYQSLFDAEVVSTQRATKIIDLAQEQRVASRVFNGSNFTPDPVSVEWDTAATATPIEDVNDAVSTIRQTCGMLANTLIVSFTTFQNLKRCSEIIDLLKYTFPGIDINRMNSQQLAAVFNLEKVLVGGAVYDSADKGQAASVADLWSTEYAMVTRTSNGGDLTEPCIGRTFFWTAENAGEMPVVESYREEGKRGDVIRVRHDTDERLIKSYDASGNVLSDIASAVSVLLSNIHT